MKKTSLFVAAVIGVALAAPVAAHHNSPFDLEIGDMMDQHETAINTLMLPDSALGGMDPSNDAPTDSSGGSMPEDLDPQPNGVGVPDDPGTDNGGNRDGEPWPE